jgi:hypothetical protein
MMVYGELERILEEVVCPVLSNCPSIYLYRLRKAT